MSRILTVACIAALVAAGALAQPASPPAAAPGNSCRGWHSTWPSPQADPGPCEYRTAPETEYEIGSGQNPRLKDFASETLPVVLEHLAMAQRLDAELTGAGVPETAEDRVQAGRAPPASPRKGP